MAAIVVAGEIVAVNADVDEDIYTEMEVAGIIGNQEKVGYDAETAARKAATLVAEGFHTARAWPVSRSRSADSRPRTCERWSNRSAPNTLRQCQQVKVARHVRELDGSYAAASIEPSRSALTRSSTTANSGCPPPSTDTLRPPRCSSVWSFVPPTRGRAVRTGSHSATTTGSSASAGPSAE